MALVLAILLAAQAPAAEGWPSFGERDGYVVSWDSAGVVRKGSIVQVRVRMRSAPSNATYTNAFGRLEIDCPGNLARVLDVINYNADGSAGPSYAGERPFHSINPGSPYATLRETLCPGVQPSK